MPDSSMETRPSNESRVLILSTTAFTLLFAVWLMFGVLGIPIRHELGLSTMQFAWLAATAVLSGSLLRLPMGILTDRIGGRRALIALLLLSAMPCALVAYLHTYAHLVWAALGFGVAGNAFSLGIAWNSAWFPHHRQGLALGTFGAGNVGASLTKLIGPVLILMMPAGGLLGGLVPGGWRCIPVLYAALLVATALAVWLYAPYPDRQPGSGRSLRSMLVPLRCLRVWRFGLYYITVFGAYVALSLWLPSLYQELYHVTLAAAALLTTVFIFPASLLRPLGGWLSDRYGARPITYATFAVMLLAAVPLAIPGSRLHLGIVAFTSLVSVLGIGMGIGKAAVYRYVPDYFPDDVGAVGGLVGTLGALGGFLLPLLFGCLQQALGSPQSCFAVLVVLIGVNLLWLHTVVMGIKRRERVPGREVLAAMSPVEQAACVPSHV